MAPEGTITSSMRHDHTNVGQSPTGRYEINEIHDQQTVAASNTLCSLSQRHEPPSYETVPFNPQMGNGYYSLPVPSSLGSYEDLAYTRKYAWTTPITPDHPGFWTVETHPHAPFNGADEEYSGPATMPSPPVGHFTTSAPLQQYTPPSDTFSVPLSDGSSPYPPVDTNPSSFNSTRTSSIEPASERLAYSDPLINIPTNPAETTSDVPYAKLIERALLEADGNRLFLKDIYNWIEDNTNKATTASADGWKNSVRHNLSMNGAFKQIEVRSTSKRSKKACMWMLDPEAKKNGIQSTTRYRRKIDKRRSDRIVRVNTRRVTSGRRGGWAAQKSARARRNSQTSATSHFSGHESSLVSDSPQSSSPERRERTSPPDFGPGGFYYPSSLPPPPPPPQLSQYAGDGALRYSFANPYAPLQPMMQFGIPLHANSVPTMWSAATSTMMNHAARDCSET